MWCLCTRKPKVKQARGISRAHRNKKQEGARPVWGPWAVTGRTEAKWLCTWRGLVWKWKMFTTVHHTLPYQLCPQGVYTTDSEPPVLTTGEPRDQKQPHPERQFNGKAKTFSKRWPMEVRIYDDWCTGRERVREDIDTCRRLNSLRTHIVCLSSRVNENEY